MTLSNVQVGDYITIRSRSSVRITRVARVTKVYVITSGGSKFVRRTGEESPCNPWHTCSATPTTPADRATPTTPADREEIAKRRRLRQVLTACREFSRTESLTDDQVSALHETLVRVGLLTEKP